MSYIEIKPIAIVAGKELRDRIRNRWVLAIAVVFAAFALLIAYFGAAQQGAVGFRGIEVTIASLTSLVIYLLPLIALILGFDAIVGERERGSLDLLLSLPITRLELLLGKYLGLAAALSLSTLLGFGLTGILFVAQAESGALFHYVGFVASSILMGLSFLSIAILLSTLASDRTRASGAAIGVWFFFVLVFDLILLGLLVASGGDSNSAVLPYLLLLNPADIFRILNIFSMDEVKTLYGLATVFPPELADPWRGDGAVAGDPADACCLEVQIMLKRNLALATLMLSLLAACGKEEKPVQLTEPTRDTACSLDGMTLVDYPGPKGQIHYASGEVSWFCDTPELVSIYLKPAQQKTIRAALVQDMGKTSWDKPQGNWIDATKAFYVQGSKKHGSMGPTLATFGAQADADKFVAENGGKVLKFGELTPDMVRLDGGMQHDQHM